MDRYIWTDKHNITHVINRSLISSSASAYSAREEEILRLAQRVQELEEREKRRWTGQQFADLEDLRVKAAAFDSSEREREALVKRVQALEGELRSALASCNTTEMARLDTLQHLRMAEIARDKAKAAAKEWHQEAIDRAVNLRHEESKGRQYCEELAEKAEEIRGLRETCVMLNRQIEETLRLADDRLAVMKRLRTAADEAVAHVEKAREAFAGNLLPVTGMDQLDLAREVLTAEIDCTRTTARMNAADARMLAAEAAMRFQDRVAALEGAVEQPQKLEIKRGLDAREGKA